MCLYPKLIYNKKYKANKKNGGNVPKATDPRVLQVPVGCGKCMECKKQKANHWKVRLQEDIKEHKNGKFVTFTFSEESLRKLQNDINPNLEGYEIDNEIATLAVRRFLERFRKEYKVSLRHWLVTELGQNNTERIHLHGIIYTDLPKKKILEIWQYGNMGWDKTWKEEENYVNGASVGYLVKYLHKADEKHPNYQSKILTSKGIGAHYTNSPTAKQNEYKPGETKEYYRTEKGHKAGLPIYYRNKLYSEQERENLWIEKLDKQERYVNGIKVSTKDGLDQYIKLLEQEREKNRKLGYGNDEKNWNQINYEKQLRNQKAQKRK